MSFHLKREWKLLNQRLKRPRICFCSTSNEKQAHSSEAAAPNCSWFTLKLHSLYQFCTLLFVFYGVDGWNLVAPVLNEGGWDKASVSQSRLTWIGNTGPVDFFKLRGEHGSIFHLFTPRVINDGGVETTACTKWARLPWKVGHSPPRWLLFSRTSVPRSHPTPALNRGQI